MSTQTRTTKLLLNFDTKTIAVRRVEVASIAVAIESDILVPAPRISLKFRPTLILTKVEDISTTKNAPADDRRTPTTSPRKRKAVHLADPIPDVILSSSQEQSRKRQRVSCEDCHNKHKKCIHKTEKLQSLATATTVHTSTNYATKVADHRQTAIETTKETEAKVIDEAIGSSRSMSDKTSEERHRKY